MQPDTTDADVQTILDVYDSITFAPPNEQYTVLAAFYLTKSFERTATLPAEGLKIGMTRMKVISLATGTKCLPAERLPRRGEALHDCHAEVLARRGVVRWLLEEIRRCASDPSSVRSPENGETFPGSPSKRPANSVSEWLRCGSDGRYALQDGIELNLYVSTVPCGDASMRLLASVQDATMAQLKDSNAATRLQPPPHTASRGRDDYSRLGVLRTKPGRADALPAISMSCSDKLAAWGVLGIQGALVSQVMCAPVCVSRVVLGEVPSTMERVVGEDCERALWGRLQIVKDLPHGYVVRPQKLEFTSVPFVHSRTLVAESHGGVNNHSTGSCSESLCWVADNGTFEVLINGVRRGLSPKHRFKEKSRPKLSRIALFNLYQDILNVLSRTNLQLHGSYNDIKMLASEYQEAKQVLMGPDGVFSGWLRSGKQWQRFYLDGTEVV